jgi:thymidylate synthase (FAD)
MKIIKPSYEIMTPINRNEILKSIEIAGRTCYKSEDKITDDSASKFVTMLINRGHEAMIEHQSLTVKFVCDRGVSHEIVRHRIASYAQESTRYCNYSNEKFGNEITVILPFWFADIHENGFEFGDRLGQQYSDWERAMESCEKYYFEMLKDGATPQEARSVLPNSLKTEIVVTMNLREWRHFFKLRTSKAAHPQMQEIIRPLLKELKEKLPEIFNDIIVEG